MPHLELCPICKGTSELWAYYHSDDWPPGDVVCGPAVNPALAFLFGQAPQSETPLTRTGPEKCGGCNGEKQVMIVESHETPDKFNLEQHLRDERA